MKGFVMMRALGLTLIFTIMSPLAIFADKVVLKDGRTIRLEGIWEENDQVKGRSKGAVVGFSKKDVERIEIDPVEPPSQGHEGFRFDVWRSGLTVYQVMDIAERNDIPIARDGLITISKNFKADMSRKYARSHNRFHYQSTLLGRPAKVELQFTPKSRKLYTLSISWGGPGASKTEPFGL